MNKPLLNTFAKARNIVVKSIIKHIEDNGIYDIKHMPELSENEEYFKGIDIDEDTRFGHLCSISKVYDYKSELYTLLIVYKDANNNIRTEDDIMFSMDDFFDIINSLE